MCCCGFRGHLLGCYLARYNTVLALTDMLPPWYLRKNVEVAETQILLYKQILPSLPHTLGETKKNRLHFTQDYREKEYKDHKQP